MNDPARRLFWQSVFSTLRGFLDKYLEHASGPATVFFGDVKFDAESVTVEFKKPSIQLSEVAKETLKECANIGQEIGQQIAAAQTAKMVQDLATAAVKANFEASVISMDFLKLLGQGGRSETIDLFDKLTAQGWKVDLVRGLFLNPKNPPLTPG
ncbi:MAG TPA: hypothetical protein VGY56_10470 [Verrucomicrobiae bacterium]|nr:hypothetical protein [Verrucomicrobiae bacterium]